MSKLNKLDQAPHFTLPSQSGERFHLQRIIGKKMIVLYFYPKDNTPTCTKESCSFRDSYQAFKDADAEVIGISRDSVESHNTFSSSHKLPFTLLSDPDGKVHELYGVSGGLFGILPGRITFVIDLKGTIQHIFSGLFKSSEHVDEALKIVKLLKA